MGEFDLIAAIRRASAPRANARVLLGIGDDCAALRFTPGAPVLVTTDMLMDGRHFRLDEAGPLAVGRKAMGVNLSDLAAMAAVPIAAVVAVALPRDRAAALAGPLHEGLRRMAERFGVALVGGDTNAWAGPLVISVSALGEATAAGPAPRSAARPGDAVLVTGPLGGSLLGRHLDPRPRVAEALALRRAVSRLACIDISDGLASDLGHILEESGGLGAILDEAAIPIHADAHRLAGLDGRTQLDHALNDGEDFELCLTVSEPDAARLLADPPAPAVLHRIGTVTATPGLSLRRRDGATFPIEPGGFDHLRADHDR